MLHRFLPLFLMASQRLCDTDEGVNGGTNSRDHSRDRRRPVLFAVVQYTEQYGDRFDDRCINTMRLTDDMQKF